MHFQTLKLSKTDVIPTSQMYMSIISQLMIIGDERVIGMASSGITFLTNFMTVMWLKKIEVATHHGSVTSLLERK